MRRIGRLQTTSIFGTRTPVEFSIKPVSTRDYRRECLNLVLILGPAKNLNDEYDTGQDNHRYSTPPAQIPFLLILKLTNPISAKGSHQAKGQKQHCKQDFDVHVSFPFTSFTICTLCHFSQ